MYSSCAVEIRALQSSSLASPLLQMEELVGERHPDSGHDCLLLHHHLLGTHGVDDDCKLLLCLKRKSCVSGSWRALEKFHPPDGWVA